MALKKADKDFYTWIGFDSRNCRLLAGDTLGTDGNLRPGQYVGILSRPQIPFRGERLFVWQKNASSFLIHGVQVGNRATMASAGILPADAFATPMDKLAKVDELFERDKVVTIKIDVNGYEAMGQWYSLPLAHPGVDIMMYVENIGGTSERFIGAFCGKTHPLYVE